MVNNNIKILLCLIFLMPSSNGCANERTKTLQKNTPASYAYVFGKVNAPNIRSAYAANTYVTPASCQKVITALLAYKTLGPDYSYETKLYITRPNGKIHDVIISFTGDPTLKTADLLLLLEPLKKIKITGKIFLDVSTFKLPAHSPNLMLNDLGTEYAQPVSSINLDENLITVVIYPGSINNLATLTNNLHYPIKTTVITNNAPSAITLKIYNNHILAQGNINYKSLPHVIKISPLDLDYFILKKIKPLLKRINLTNEVVILKDTQNIPTKRILLNTINSEPLSTILTPALKKSDNLVFDAIYLKMIHLYGNDQIAKWEDGDNIIKDLLKKYFNLTVDSAKFVDGSGLSRYNQIQPQQLFAILQQGYNYKEFVAALPSPGEPGSTLAKRKDLANYVKAKTGYMSGITCLCGYGISKKPAAFVIVTNNFTTPTKKIFSTIDNFVNNWLEKNL